MLSASDVKYSFERILDPNGKSPNTWILDKIYGAKTFMKGVSSEVSGIAVSYPYTVRTILEKAFSPFLNLLTMTAGYVVPKEEVQRRGEDFATHPVGSGPFRLTEWKHNNHLLLERNEDYFEGMAMTRGLRYRIIPEDLTAITEFELGNLDVIAVPASEYRRIMKTDAGKNLVSAMEGINNGSRWMMLLPDRFFSLGREHRHALVSVDRTVKFFPQVQHWHWRSHPFHVRLV